MKKLITLVFILLVSTQMWAVAIKVVEQSKITFHNFSAGSYDVSNHILTVGTTQYNINNLVILSGAINTTAGSFLQVEVNMFSTSAGSIALWAPGTSFPNPNSALLVDFVQYGAAGQPYEAEAAAAGRWSVGAFVNAGLPITRSNNYGSFGASEWASSVTIDENTLSNIVSFQPLPFQNELNLRFEQGHGISEIVFYNVLGQLLLTKQVMQQTLSLTINTSDLQNGVYLVELRRIDGRNIVRKVIKR